MLYDRINLKLMRFWEVGKMIKAVDKISVKKKSQKQMIREDFAQAISMGIDKFEFVGEDYNHKYLVRYVRDEAKHIVINDMRRRARELKATGVPIPNWVQFYQANFERYLEITHGKDDNGVNHVYCKINRDGLDAIWNEFALPLIEKTIDKTFHAKLRRK